MLNTLFGDTFKSGWAYGGRYNDSKMGSFIKDQIDDKNFKDLSSLPSILSQYETIQTSTQDVISASKDVVDNVNKAIDRIQSPNINVNVTTNVDKSGNATSRVDINSMSRDVARRSSQYGQTAVIN